MRVHETQTYHDLSSSSMLKDYDGKHEYQHTVIESENRPHFTRDDVPQGVILDHPGRGKDRATRAK